MQRMKFGPHDFTVSRFGFGAMRLPRVETSPGQTEINEDEAIRMIRYAVDRGVNYIDTAYGYTGSEIVVGKALKNGCRDRAKIATKLPSWAVDSYDDCMRFLDEELARLQVDCIDIYLVHALRQVWWEKLRSLDVLKFLDKAKRQGKIRLSGFSFHDSLVLFKEIIDAYAWDMCQIQLNYMDEHVQAGVEGLRYAAAKGLPVVIMEPLKGGSLANNLPAEARALFNHATDGINPVSMAFRWLARMPEVTVILSGVSTMEQTKEDIDIFERLPAGPLDEKETRVMDELREIFNKRQKIGCTACAYCLPCPEGVAIPDLFQLYNSAFLLNATENSKVFYRDVFAFGKKDAAQCRECGTCEEKCPQRLEIINLLKEVHALLK